MSECPCHRPHPPPQTHGSQRPTPQKSLVCSCFLSSAQLPPGPSSFPTFHSPVATQSSRLHPARRIYYLFQPKCAGYFGWWLHHPEPFSLSYDKW